MKQEITTFCGFSCPLEEAEIFVFGAPFDNTASFRPGTRFGPQAMRPDSWGLESYSPYHDRDLEDLKVVDLGDLNLPFGNPAKVLNLVHKQVEEIMQHKTPSGVQAKSFMLGGEHLLTQASVHAVHKHFPDLHLMHFDAHTDLRTEYLGEPLSHACVIRKCYDFLGDGRVHSFGIRSGLKEEWDFARQHLDFHPYTLNDVPASLAQLDKRTPLYITLDLDVLDPSVMPGTGTPEPGGVSFKELQEAFLAFRGYNVVAMDIMELSPPYDHSGISVAAACKALREMLLLWA